jgi:rubrerythrin
MKRRRRFVSCITKERVFVNTNDNVQKSFVMNSTAATRCVAYAEIAEKEGLHQLAKFFRAFADAYKVGATNALKAIGGMSNTEDNLANIVDANSYDLSQLYPKFIEQAEQEGDPSALTHFKGILASFKTHTNLLNEALKNFNRFRDTDYWVCQKCGYMESGDMPLTCKICGGSRETFKRIS